MGILVKPATFLGRRFDPITPSADYEGQLY
jgi:hypothetical protein